jgi:hAT family C-terminal dimerisation region
MDHLLQAKVNVVTLIQLLGGFVLAARSCLELRKIATTLLSLSPSSCHAERSFSAQESIRTL